ncbi:hypothetical protein JOB18_007797 [Solea senegalensis]|uniref:DUF5580 domain-containing protein n=1 Tax=Solea senegalensis TaxID=28829 RepID=A0AAV6PDU4_SOLSE|nr:uncharacterized protein C1orf87 isoform X1 [Solea senegalensis]KAG7459158.1 hypothetical protein JOB18_007797 [Solea senegalensis]
MYKVGQEIFLIQMIDVFSVLSTCLQGNCHHIAFIMAQKNTSGPNTIPRLVVKIIGSKHVKQFIHERQEDTQHAPEETAAAQGSREDSEKPPEKQDGIESVSHPRLHNRADSVLWAGINQVPDRLCVTAPSGDRSRSYIHPRTPHITGRRATAVLETTRESLEDTERCELSSAVREELCDWQISSLRSAEDEMAALDPSSSGTVHRSQITHLFLKHDVPLKLPTFSLLLHEFSDINDPVLIYYRKLLQFLEASAFSTERAR